MKLKRIIIKLFFCFVLAMLFASIKLVKVNSLVEFTEVNIVRSYETDKTSYKTVEGTTNFQGSTNNQLIHTFIQKQTSTSKVVTWAVKKDGGALGRETLASICIDYEKNHPDYEVIGGINADQFTLGFGSSILDSGKDFYNTQPYYPMIADQEGWFIMTSLPVNGAGNVLYLHTDGRSNPIERHKLNLNNGDKKILGPFLYILDSTGARIKKYQLSGVNETPKDNETSVYACYNTKDDIYKDVKVKSEFEEKNIFVIKNADRCYPSNSIDYVQKDQNAQNAFFGKGVITEVTDSTTLSYGDFAIVTKDFNLINDLDKGVEVIVQYEIEDEDGQIESAIGFHTVQRENGVDRTLAAGDSYNNRKYPRSVIGSTENGEIFLLAIDGLQERIGAPGAHFDEINAILRYYGVTNAYQMDGGGSVTACIRNDKGGFDVVNHPSDGSSRRVLSAVLLVEEKKPKIDLLVSDVTLDNITIQYNLSKSNYSIESLIFIIDNQEYNLNISGESELELNVERGKKYNYSYKYVYSEEGLLKETNVDGEIYLPLIPPKLTLTRNGDTFYIDIEDKDKTLINYYLVIGEDTYSFTDNILKVDLYDSVLLGYSFNNGNKVIYRTIIHPESSILNALNNLHSHELNDITLTNIFNE